MARKRKDGKPTISAELRNMIRENRSITFPEAFAALKEKFGGNINENSCSSSFYLARQQVGVTGRQPAARKRAAKKTAARRRRGNKRTVRKRRPAAQSIDIDRLQSAVKFIAEVGDADRAIAAIKQVKALQVR